MTNPPGLNREGAEFLAKAGAVTIGSDNHCVEQVPSADPENWQVVHLYLLAEAGIPMMEIVNLEELAGEKIYEYAFFGACIKLRGATGSPMRPVAMPLLELRRGIAWPNSDHASRNARVVRGNGVGVGAKLAARSAPIDMGGMPWDRRQQASFSVANGRNLRCMNAANS